MQSACPGFTCLGPPVAVPRTDQSCCHGVAPAQHIVRHRRSLERACRRELHSLQQTQFTTCQTSSHYLGTAAGHGRQPTLVLQNYFHSFNLQRASLEKQRSRSTCLQAFQYDLLSPSEPSSKPLDVCKRWLYNIFPILRNEELVSRTAWTLMVIAIARLGQQLTIPCMDVNFAPQSGAASRPSIL